MKRLFALLLILLICVPLCVSAGNQIGSAPGGEDVSAGGSEKIPVDDAGTGKYMTVDTLLARALAAYAWMGSINGLTEADVSVLETTADNTYNVVTSGGNNYILGSNSDNSALEFKTPANVLTQIGGQATHAYLTDIAGITANQGDIIYFDGSDWVDLAPGDSGKYLKTQGAGANPTWDTPAGGSGDVTKVGDCETGDCLDGSSDGGTYISLYDGNSNYSKIQAGNSTADLTFTLPTAYAGASDYLLKSSDAGVLGYTDPATFQAASAALASIAGLNEADVSVLECTADNAYAVVTSGGNNYILGSNSDNTALEFKTPANVLSQIGAQATDADLTSLAGGVTGIVKGAGDGNGYSAATAGTDYSMPYNVRVECTADTNLTEIQCWNTHVTNQGAAGEVDLKLYATSYGCAVTFISEEAQVIEINPPTDEILYLNGTALDTNDCVDSDGVEGSMIKAFRHKDSSGAWHWYLITITGVWADTGASD